MVLITRSYLDGLSGEIRELNVRVAELVSELVDDNVWSGADADRFEASVAELVLARLDQAAALIDSAALVRIAPF